MTTSDQLKLIETYSQKATNSKPVGTYTKREILELEHKWRIKLKKSGFQDIEMWDNKPRKRIKKIKFIKGHIRRSSYNYYRFHAEKGPRDSQLIRAKEYDEMYFWRGFSIKAQETSEYFRIIGLYAHHAPKNDMPEKYRKLLQVYATCGYRNEAIRKVAPKVKPSAIEMYLNRNFKRMIEFVRQLDESERTIYG